MRHDIQEACIYERSKVTRMVFQSQGHAFLRDKFLEKLGLCESTFPEYRLMYLISNSALI